MIDDIKVAYNLARRDEAEKSEAKPDDIKVTTEMLAAAIAFLNEKHDGEEIPLVQLIHEAYVVMELIRRKFFSLDREMQIAEAVKGVVGHA